MTTPAEQPLVIAVTGHRDLVAEECDQIRERIRSLFDTLRSRYPHLKLQLMSPMAEGADQLAAEVALESSVDLLVALPMPVPEYVADFSDSKAVENFHALCDQADEFFVLTEEYAGMSNEERYAQLGIFQADHCHILLAIWDGKDSDLLGGTSQVVRYHHDDYMPHFERKSGVSQQMLLDDESDLVFHVVCSRDRDNGAPAEGLSPLDWHWFTKDETQPRSHQLPDDHHIVFRRADEFARDAERHAAKIEAESFSLLTDESTELDLPGLRRINDVFRIADCLAIHFQRKALRTLRVTHVLAFVMGTLFVLYSDLMTWQLLLYVFLICFVTAAVVQLVAGKRKWYRKYLDYRTLAEGLRVQFYWAMAGITQENLDRHSHNNFLQLQDAEVGWIRNTMRIAGTLSDAMPHRQTDAVDIVINEWVGNEGGGQLGYYRTKADERLTKNKLTAALGKLSLATSAAVVVLFLVAGESLPEPYVDPLMVLMGVTLLLFGVRHAYAYAIAEQELIKQYEFMLRIFAYAAKRLGLTGDDRRRRQILMALGSSALDEHAQWILMHRERSVNQTEIWRIGSGS